MLLVDRPRSLLPATAYVDAEWFRAEQRSVGDTTWHAGDGGTVVDHWEGMAFSSHRPVAPLDVALGDLPVAMGSVRPSLLTEVARRDLDGRFNWKLFIENHIDVLHLWYLHDVSLGGFDHARFEHRAVGPHWASYEPVRPGRAGPVATPITHLDPRDRAGLGAHLLFPDTPMATGAELFVTYRCRPTGPDRSVIELRVLAEQGADPDPLVRTALSFIEEDMEVCERIQEVAASRHFEVGPLARTHEAPIVEFHRNLLRLLDREPRETEPT